jgi:hypothetical protein
MPRLMVFRRDDRHDQEQNHTVNPIPTGYHTLSPYPAVPDVAAAVGFSQRAFGAEVVSRMVRLAVYSCTPSSGSAIPCSRCPRR